MNRFGSLVAVGFAVALTLVACRGPDGPSSTVGPPVPETIGSAPDSWPDAQVSTGWVFVVTTMACWGDEAPLERAAGNVLAGHVEWAIADGELRLRAAATTAILRPEA